MPDSIPEKTIILLHGLGGNASDWVMNSRIGYLAERYHLAVLMPEVQKSVYTNMMYGDQYFDYVADELPELAHRMFGVPIERENLMVAGLSMGGYGSMRIAFGRPEKFGYCGSFSGNPNMQSVITENVELNPVFARSMYAVYGPTFQLGEENDIYCLTEKALANGVTPRVYSVCGTEDGNFDRNSAYAEKYKDKLDITFVPMPGNHEWAVWSVAIEDMFKHFFGEPKNPFAR
jgi:S-formylglutathione hydrolase FrmB